MLSKKEYLTVFCSKVQTIFICLRLTVNCNVKITEPTSEKYQRMSLLKYSHLFNKRGGWNKRGGGAKVAKSLNVEVGINVEGGIFWKKLVHNSNKRGVEGGKI